MTLTRRGQLFFVIAVLTLVASGVAVLWLFIAPLFWGFGALFLGLYTPISIYLYISRRRERTMAVWQNNWWSAGRIKLMWRNFWSVLQLVLFVGLFVESIDQLAGLAPQDDGLNRRVFLGVIAYCGGAAIFFPRVWPLLYGAGLVSTPALRDIVRFSWERRPRSS